MVGVFALYLEDLSLNPPEVNIKYFAVKICLKQIEAGHCLNKCKPL